MVCVVFVAFCGFLWVFVAFCWPTLPHAPHPPQEANDDLDAAVKTVRDMVSSLRLDVDARRRKAQPSSCVLGDQGPEGFSVGNRLTFFFVCFLVSSPKKKPHQTQKGITFFWYFLIKKLGD